MYTLKVPFKDIYKKPRNETVHFHLFEREVMKLLVELKYVFDWIESVQDKEVRQVDTAEVVAFYTALEEIILSSVGEPEDDGLGFTHAKRYEFESKAVFNAIMLMIVGDPQEGIKLLNGIMPEGMEDLVKQQDASLEKVAKETEDKNLQRQLDELRAQLKEKEAGS